MSDARTDPSNPYDPLADFPPFGYLDNPKHSWKLHPSGVLRSRPPAGMGWHVPNFGSYGRNQFMYRAHLHVGIEVGGTRLLTPREFQRLGVPVRAFVHTANRLGYVFRHPAGPEVRATYFLIYGTALGCKIEIMRGPGQTSEESIRVWLALELAHNPATSRFWEHGMYARLPGPPVAGSSPLGALGICPEGDAWVLGAGAGAVLIPRESQRLDEPWEAGSNLPMPPESREPASLQRATLLLGYDLAVPEQSRRQLYAVLTQEVSVDRACDLWRGAMGAFRTKLATHTAEDERFWQGAPRLAGDWPGYLARGLATDLETLRMVVRRKAGQFMRHWDGMQIQAPRKVLAETALDALALAWADPALAREILLAAFYASRRSNVPCMREDGSFNMVADDGTVCGTGPEWGWPLAVVDELWRRSGDRNWLEQINSGCWRYMDFWLAERVDSEGWPVHACSWESGQDVSARFGEQRTGGSDVRHIRPVDLAAALAQGFALLASWTDALGKPPKHTQRWREEAARMTERVRALWRDGWYHDWDARAGRPSRVRDPMQLAPLACGLAGPEQVAALAPAFSALPKHGGVWPPLVWPPVAHTVLEAALAAGQDIVAADLAARIVERTWLRMDARVLEPDGSLPGVTREFWPEGGARESAGIEGYGWGALTVHFLIRYIVGLRTLAPDRFALVPALPAAWRPPGASLAIGPLAYGAGRVSITYRVPEDPAAQDVEISIALAGMGETWVARAADGVELARSSPAAPGEDGVVSLRWRGRWQERVVVEWAARPAAGGAA